MRGKLLLAAIVLALCAFAAAGKWEETQMDRNTARIQESR